MIDAGDFNLILLAEHRLGLPPLFYFKLMEIQDDWAFVLKLHALFEGTIYRLLHEKQNQFEFPEPILKERDSFSTMVQTAGRYFLTDNLGESVVSARHYLLALNRLRNLITHDLGFIDIQLNRYVASLSEVNFQTAARSLAISYPNQPLNDPQSTELIRKLTELLLPLANPATHRITKVRELCFAVAPKPTIWSGGGRVLTALSLCLHIQPTGDSMGEDPQMAAKLQDLLHDPEVIEFKRNLAKEFGTDLT
jgi:hypothetical protein